jgi:hypothetical protein
MIRELRLSLAFDKTFERKAKEFSTVIKSGEPIFRMPHL